MKDELWEMTNQEAIETIKANYPDESYTMLREALDIAIKALEQYIPEYVNNINWDYLYTSGDCPNCGIRIYQRYHPIRCGVCGQAVSWG